MNMHIELVFDVEYDYQPPEAKVMYPNDSAHPGCDAEVTICSVKKGDVELIDELTKEDIKSIEQMVWADMEAKFNDER